MWKTAVAVLALAGCGSTTDVGSATTAEVQCERFIANELGQPVRSITYEHRATKSTAAPTYTVRGRAVAGPATKTYQCVVTFDGDSAWKLDSLSFI